MRRRWPWVVAGSILALVAWEISAGQPRQSMAEQAVAYDAKRAVDPVSGPEDKAVGESLRALVAVTAAPDLALQAQERWSEDRVPNGTADRSDVVSAPDRAAFLMQQAKSWRAALLRRPSTDDLAQTCVYQVPYAQCNVGASGEVPGSHGALCYQAAGRFLAERQGADANRLFQADEAAARSDPMVGATVDIFAADPAGDGAWCWPFRDSHLNAPSRSRALPGRCLPWREGIRLARCCTPSWTRGGDICIRLPGCRLWQRRRLPERASTAASTWGVGRGRRT